MCANGLAIGEPSLIRFFMKQNYFLAAVLKSQGAVAGLLVALGLAVFGIGLMSSALEQMLEQYLFVPASLGFLLVVIGWGLTVRVLTSVARISRRFEAAVSYHKTRNDLVNLPGYAFHEFMQQTLSGLMVERSSLVDDWNNDPLSGTFTHNAKTGAYQKKETAASQVLADLTEFWVLMSLGQHLKAYYNPEDFDGTGHIELIRNDIPKSLLQNRCLELLTQNWVDRGELKDVRAALKRLAQVSVYIPIGSTIQRGKGNSFVIQTRTFRLTVEAVSKGFTVKMPPRFITLYEGQSVEKEVQHFQVKLKVVAQFNGSALLTQGGWEDYAWAMSWVDSLEKEFSKEAFLEQIEWQRTMAVSRVLHHAQQLQKLKNAQAQGA